MTTDHYRLVPHAPQSRVWPWDENLSEPPGICLLNVERLPSEPWREARPPSDVIERAEPGEQLPAIPDDSPAWRDDGAIVESDADCLEVP